MILITSLITFLLVLCGHYFPWRLALGRDLPRPIAVLGVVSAIFVPLAILFAWWVSTPPEASNTHLVALLAVTFTGLAAVVGSNALDRYLDSQAQAREATELYDLSELEGRDGSGEG